MTTPETIGRPPARRMWRYAFGVPLAAVCLVLLLRHVSGQDLIDTWHRIAPLYAVAGFGVVLVSYLLKAARFRILLGRAAPFGKLFGVTIAQNVIAQIVPARAGDLSYIVLVRRTRMASVGYALASLVICRFVDLILILAMYLGSLSVLRPENPLFARVAWGVGGLMTLAVLLAAVLLIGRRRVVDRFERLLDVLRLLRLRPVAYLWRELREALPHIAQLRPARHLLPTLGASLLIWASTLCWIWLIWRAVDVPLDAPQLLFIFSFTHILGLLPIFFFGGVGTGDVVNATVLAGLGIAVSVSQAGAFALCNRVLSLLYQLALAILAVFLLNRSNGADPVEEPREA